MSKGVYMDKIIIQGGNNRLVGTVQIEGAKNAVLLFWLQPSWQVKEKRF